MLAMYHTLDFCFCYCGSAAAMRRSVDAELQLRWRHMTLHVIIGVI